ncbi:MAG: hypothetical protein M3R13_07545 [Armatimonadota bacterium]|nr:hypothetical protein [Armatimonadota bacterium]
MSKKRSYFGLLGWAAAFAGVGAAAVAIIRVLRERSEGVDEAIDDLIDFYNGKADELDRLVTETEIRIAN